MTTNTEPTTCERADAGDVRAVASDAMRELASTLDDILQEDTCLLYDDIAYPDAQFGDEDREAVAAASQALSDAVDAVVAAQDRLAAARA